MRWNKTKKRKEKYRQEKTELRAKGNKQEEDADQAEKQTDEQRHAKSDKPNLD